MKKLIVLIIILIILGLIFYAAETKEILRITGKHSNNLYKDIKKSQAIENILDDLKEKYDKSND